MLPSLLLKFFYLLSLVYFALAGTHRVNHDDPNIQYIPRVCDLDCTRVCQEEWWLSCLSGGQSSHRTKGNNTQATFTFRGSSITWYTRTANDGGKAVVYLDDDGPVYIDTNAPVVNEAKAMFTKTGLDPTVSHTINVLFDTSSFQADRLLERFVDVRYFDYDDGEGAQGAAQSNTQTTTRTNSGSSSSSTSSRASSVTGSATSGSTSQNSTATGGAVNTLAPAFATLSGNAGSGAGGGSSGGDTVSVGNPGGSSSNHISLAATIGAALGGLAGGLIIFFIIFWLRRERAHRRAVIAPEQKEAQEDNGSTRGINGNNAATLPTSSNNNSTTKFIEARYSYPNARRRFHISAYPGILGIGNGSTSRGREQEQGGYQQQETRTNSPIPPSATGSIEDTFDMTSPRSPPPGSGVGSLGLSLYPPPPGPFESGSLVEDSTTDPSFMTPPPRYIQ